MILDSNKEKELEILEAHAQTIVKPAEEKSKEKEIFILKIIGLT